jgi:iron complex transport system ATP-binding protein
MSKAIYSLSNVSMYRQGVSILDSLSFEMLENQRWAILGPNGSGKSFLLRTLSADLLPSQGQIEILGERIGKTDMRALREKIGFVSSRMEYEFPEGSICYDIVLSGFRGTYGYTWKPQEAEHQKAQQVLIERGLSEYKNRKFATLSDGEKKRVLIARALVREPQVLLFDEASAGLDIVARKSLLQEIDTLSKNIPYIYVTHHIEEFPDTVSHVLFIKAGKSFDQGTKQYMIDSQKLSTLFDAQIDIVQKGNRFYSMLQ